MSAINCSKESKYIFLEHQLWPNSLVFAHKSSRRILSQCAARHVSVRVVLNYDLI